MEGLRDLLDSKGSRYMYIFPIGRGLPNYETGNLLQTSESKYYILHTANKKSMRSRLFHSVDSHLMSSSKNLAEVMIVWYERKRGSVRAKSLAPCLPTSDHFEEFCNCHFHHFTNSGETTTRTKVSLETSKINHGAKKALLASSIPLRSLTESERREA